MKQHRIYLLILAVLLPGIACNYPRPQTTRNPLSADALRQTLAALSPAPITPSPEATSASIHPTRSNELPSGTPSHYPYIIRSGDTLEGLQARFGTPLEQLFASSGLPIHGYLPVDFLIAIPNSLDPALPTTPDILLLPDHEAIYSPTAADFDVFTYVREAGGYLASYQETVDGESVSGAEIIQRVASEASVNPRLLLAFLDYRAGWVSGQPFAGSNPNYPLGFAVPGRTGLYEEMVMATLHLNIGYYGWREGKNISLRFADGSTLRIHPLVNAGTAGLQNLFAKLYEPVGWREALYGQENFLARYAQLFGDPWERADAAGPLLPNGLSQPPLELPFAPGERWSLSGGPHTSWNAGTPRGALDFSPVTDEAVCAVSRAWARAAAPGVVARSAHNVLALDLDGDGYEGTGWVLVYLHLAAKDMAPAGITVGLDDPLGHPSCERGRSTGKHVHLARKYNGEWLAADGPLPFVLSGWQAKAGERNYQGSLVRGDEEIIASPSGTRSSIIIR